MRFFCVLISFREYFNRVIFPKCVCFLFFFSGRQCLCSNTNWCNTSTAVSKSSALPSKWSAPISSCRSGANCVASRSASKSRTANWRWRSTGKHQPADPSPRRWAVTSCWSSCRAIAWSTRAARWAASIAVWIGSSCCWRSRDSEARGGRAT